ncbi:MAG: ATP-binding protein [Candidatus Omnitrophota bacterium]|nr:ATP-binding protein [Candidatus Omnitrophota bacterium]
MKIHLPNSAFLGNVDPFLKGFDPSFPHALEITTNESWLSLHPLVLSMTAALGLTVDPKQITFAKPSAKSAHYLVRMGLFGILNIPCEISIQEHAPEGRFIPLTQIHTPNELTKFIAEMIPLLHQEPEQAKTISHIISELVRNVIEHAQSTKGAIVCAQYYRKTNRIAIGIADTGVGLKASINRSHAADTDLDAIRLALWPGITGTTRRPGGTGQNAGAGLFIIKSIADVNQDFFVMYSGGGFYKLLKKRAPKLSLKADPFADRHTKDGRLPYWKGTVVGVDISLDNTKEFSVLLSAIRKAYSGLKKRNGYRRKPRFL